MNATQLHPSASNLTVVYMLSQLLEKLERSRVPVGPDQYRSVVTHLLAEFEHVDTDPSFSALLDAHPAAAELYENLHYVQAGLCRSSLESSLNAESSARALIQRVQRSASARRPDGPR